MLRLLLLGVALFGWAPLHQKMAAQERARARGQPAMASPSPGLFHQEKNRKREGLVGCREEDECVIVLTRGAMYRMCTLALTSGPAPRNNAHTKREEVVGSRGADKRG